MIIPQCTFCKHYTAETVLPACSAFPAGIPNEIFFKGVDHSKPYPGDHGIQFEAADAEAAQLSIEPVDDEEQSHA